MEKDLKMDLQELEKKSRNAKEEQAKAFQGMFDQLEKNLTQLLNTRLDSIEKSIADEIDISKKRHRANKDRLELIIGNTEQKGLFQKIKGD